MDEEQPKTDSFPELTQRLADRPELWPEVREGVRQAFTEIAGDWETRQSPDHLAPLDAALDRVERPTRALDLGTGTGLAARLVATRFRGVDVAGIDITEEMLRQAVTRGGVVRYLLGDGSALPFGDDAFDLITAVNVFLFWDEVTRVLSPGGALAVEYSRGAQTPINLPVPEVKRHLAAAGSFAFEDGTAGEGIWIVARKVGA
jgi:ubiquinone/menaquinone biosynthesis C-methylase UbiE